MIKTLHCFVVIALMASSADPNVHSGYPNVSKLAFPKLDCFRMFQPTRTRNVDHYNINDVNLDIDDDNDDDEQDDSVTNKRRPKNNVADAK